MKLPLLATSRRPRWTGFYLIWVVAFAVCAALLLAPAGPDAFHRAATPIGAVHVSPPGQRPDRARAPFTAIAPAPARGTVWVNTRSHVYHYPGQRWYGHTQEGNYMTEADAIAEGDQVTKNGQ